MPWKNKYRGLAGQLGLVHSPSQTAPTVARVGLSQPDLGQAQMNQDLKPQGIPSQLPTVPMLNPTSSFPDHEIKKRALRNIASGRRF